MNILNSLKDLANDELMAKVSLALGVDEKNLSKVIQASIPTLLGGILYTDSKKHHTLVNIFEQAARNDNLMGDMLSNVAGGNVPANDIMQSVLNAIFWEKKSGVINILTNLGGTKVESVEIILGFVGGLVASFFGSKMKTDGLNFGDLLDLLAQEKENIMVALPDGLATTLGLSKGPAEAVQHVMKNTTNANNAAMLAVAVPVSESTRAADNATQVVKNRVSDTTMKWLWPLILLAGLAIGLLYFLKGCNHVGVKEDLEQIEGSVGVVDEQVANTSSDLVDTAVATNASGVLNEDGDWIATKGALVTLKTEDGRLIETNKGSVAEKLYQFAMDQSAVPDKNRPSNWFNFDGLLFQSGSSILKSGAEKEIATTVDVLNAFPKLKIKIGGYTDNSGDPNVNLKLSESRARMVYQTLLNKGAQKTSFDSKAFEGYGDQYPICTTNGSEACKAQNRRIAVVVISK